MSHTHLVILLTTLWVLNCINCWIHGYLVGKKRR